MIDAGLYRMCVPQALGGLETDAVDAIRVLEEVSRLDSAAGWNLMISQGSVSFCAWLSDEAAREIFAGHPHAIVAGALTPPGRAVPAEGGYRVTGRWPFVSGSNHASRLMGSAFIFDKDDSEPRLDENGPIQLLVAFPKDDVTILDIVRSRRSQFSWRCHTRFARRRMRSISSTRPPEPARFASRSPSNATSATRT